MHLDNSSEVERIMTLTKQNDLRWSRVEGEPEGFEALDEKHNLMVVTTVQVKEGLTSWLADEDRFITGGGELTYKSSSGSYRHRVSAEFVRAIKNQLTEFESQS